MLIEDALLLTNPILLIQKDVLDILISVLDPPYTAPPEDHHIGCESTSFVSEDVLHSP